MHIFVPKVQFAQKDSILKTASRDVIPRRRLEKNEIKPRKDLLMPLGNVHLDSKIRVSECPRFNVGDFVLAQPQASESMSLR